MGCGQSKIESEEAVLRCKERKQFMKKAVSSRNAFAAAHSAYVMALRNTGAALSDYGQSEVAPHHHLSTSSSLPTASSVAQTPIERFPPPPPPLPHFSPSPLLRSTSMPDLPIPKLVRKKNPSQRTTTIREDDDDDDGNEEEDVGSSVAGASAAGNSSPVPPPPLPPRDQPTPPPPPPPQEEKTWDYFFFSQTPTLTDEIRPEKEERVGDGDRFKYSRTTPSQSISNTVSSPAAGVQGGVGGEIPPPVTPEKEVADTPPPEPQQMPLKKSKQEGSVHQHAAPVGVGVSEVKRAKPAGASAPNVSLVKMLDALDDHFLKASESAAVVSRMLESTRLHYHSNFADNRGHIDHSARVMKVITWNRSFKGIPNAGDEKDDFDNDELETHATILDKLLAWEKKLYDEVKAGEVMKIKYQKTVALLNKQKKQGKSQVALEKIKAEVSHLHTRYIVDMQSMDSTVSEIQRLRDHQLYPKFSALVDEMGRMWEIMHGHHDSQLKIVMDLRSLDISCTPKETSDQHYQKTEQLHRFASEWHSHFANLVTNQKDYIQALSSWLKLNLIPIESSLKEKVSSPPRVRHPPIQALLLTWHDQLDKLPDGIARSAISSFAAVINAIMVQQQEELKIKDSCEAVRRELYRKQRHLSEWSRKHNIDFSELAAHEASENQDQNEQLTNKKFEIEALKKKLEEEEELHRKMCKQVREKSIGSLRMQLPELFRAMTDFSFACSEMYKNLRTITEVQNQTGKV